MKFTCPNCKNPGVAPLAKLFSAPYAPAKCSFCGALSAEDVWPYRSLVIVAPVALAASFFPVVWLNSWWPAALCVLALLVAPLYLLVRTPLRPVQETDAATAAKRHRGWLLVLVAVGAAIALWSLQHDA